MGHMKISPNGLFLCEAENVDVNLYNFNNATGTISFIRSVHKETGSSTVGYGVDFSPGSNYIYFLRNPGGIVQDGFIPGPSPTNDSVTLYQYNIENKKSAIVHRYKLAPSTGSTTIPLQGPWGIQLGMDDNVYVCAYGDLQQYWHYLGVINEPDLPVPNCLFDPMGLELAPPNTRHNGSLPQLVHTAGSDIWPKVYEALEYGMLKINNNGNLICAFDTRNMANNLNHDGQFAGSLDDNHVQYNSTTGITDWVIPGYNLNYTLNSGDLNFISSNYYNHTNSYRSGTTGLIITGPSVPINDQILVEDNGIFVMNTGSNIYVHPLPGGLPTPIPTISGYNLERVRAIYNNSTKNVYVLYRYYNPWTSPLFLVGIYNFNVITHTLSVVNAPNISNPLHGPIVQVNTNGEIFVFNYNNNDLEKYDPASGQHTTVSINNFVNNSLEEMPTSNQLVEDRIIIKNTNQHVFYCLNTNPLLLTAKKIPYTPPSTTIWFYNDYVFDANNNVFIGGHFTGTGFSIGNQAIPLVGASSAFLTKFNILDFSFRQSESDESLQSKTAESSKAISALIQHDRTNEETLLPGIEATLSPNPAKNSLVINLKQKYKETASSFVISITNALGVNIFTRSTKQSMLTVDVSRFRTGIYYVTIITDKGDKTTQMFVKE